MTPWIFAVAALLASEKGGELQAGTIHDGTAQNGVTYHLRLPKRYDARKHTTAIVLLHGSNMNAKTYVETAVSAWPKLAEDFVLIGIDGESRVKDSPDDAPRYNYTYVNFAGKSRYKGFPGTERESPALVTEVAEELKRDLRLKRILVGGHSQGGFLSYSCFLNYPETFAGAFPVSAGLIVQCEPSAFEDPAVRAAQRHGAVAIVHGKNDGLVSFDLARSAHESFEDDAFPGVRLFADNQAAHMFARLPVEEAVRWLESMTVDDPAALLASAQRSLGKREFRDAVGAARRAEALDEKGKHSAKIKGTLRAIDRIAEPQAKAIEKAMSKLSDGSWVDAFLEFRAQFEFAPAASKVMDLYRKLRSEHEEPARELWSAAQKDYAAGLRGAGVEKCREIVNRYYGSSLYRAAKRAIDKGS